MSDRAEERLAELLNSRAASMTNSSGNPVEELQGRVRIAVFRRRIAAGVSTAAVVAVAAAGFMALPQGNGAREPTQVATTVAASGGPPDSSMSAEPTTVESRTDVASDASTASALSASAAPSVGLLPKTGVSVGRKLFGPSWPDAGIELPATPAGQLFATPHGTVFAAGPDGSEPNAVYIVRPNGTVDQLVAGVTIGSRLAVDSSRLAYSIQVVKNGTVTSNLFLIDLVTGEQIQQLKGAPNAQPVALVGGQVILSVGDGGAGSAGAWALATNSFFAWKKAAGGIPLDAVGAIALVAQDDYSCAAVIEIAKLRERFVSCAPSGTTGMTERFALLSPDSKRFVSARSDPNGSRQAWPVVGNAASGKVDDRLRVAFTKADLVLDVSGDRAIVWEDAASILAVVLTTDGRRLVVRCDVANATCGVAVDPVSGEPIALARPSNQP